MLLTYILLAATVLISLLAFEQLGKDIRKIGPFSGHDSFAFKDKMIFSPYRINHNKEYYRFLSSGFIHAGWLHLGFNMYALYIFGSTVEYFYARDFGVMSNMHFLILYFGGMIMADISTYFKHKENGWYGSLGASGAVSAVVFAYILYQPWAGLMIFPIPIEIPAAILGILYLAYSYYASTKQFDNINHEAHFYGALFGVLYTVLLRPSIIPEFIQKVMLGLGMA